MSKEESKPLGVTPTIDMKSFMDLIAKSEDKTKITALLELLNPDKLEFITEYPTVNYTKLLTKLETWRASIKEVYNFGEEEEDIIVKEMCHQFKLKMTSHRGRRVQAIVNALRNEDSGTRIYDENKGMRKFLGMR